MAGISHLTHERRTAHFLDQMTKVVAHLKKDEVIQANAVVNNTFLPFSDSDSVTELMNTFAAAIYDNNYPVSERAKRVERLVQKYLRPQQAVAPLPPPPPVQLVEKGRPAPLKPSQPPVDLAKKVLGFTLGDRMGAMTVRLEPIADDDHDALSLLALKAGPSKRPTTPAKQPVAGSLGKFSLGEMLESLERIGSYDDNALSLSKQQADLRPKAPIFGFRSAAPDIHSEEDELAMAIALSMADQPDDSKVPH